MNYVIMLIAFIIAPNVYTMQFYNSNALNKELKQTRALSIARAIMLECKDDQGAAGLPPDLYNLVLGYALSGDKIKTEHTHTRCWSQKTMSGDGNRLIGLENGKLQCFDRKTGSTYSQLDRSILSDFSIVAASQNGNTFTGAKGRYATMFNVLYPYLTSHYSDAVAGISNDISALAVSKHNGADFHVFAFTDNKLVWGPLVGHLSLTYGHDEPATAVAIAPSHKRCASATTKEIKVWFVPDKSCLQTITHAQGATTALAFSPQFGRQVIASGHANHSMCVWDSINGNLMASFQSHDSPIKTLALPNSKTILSYTNDGAITTFKRAHTAQEALEVIDEKAEQGSCAIQ